MPQENLSVRSDETLIRLKENVRLDAEIVDSINRKIRELDETVDFRKLNKDLRVDRGGLVAWGISYHT